MSNTDVDEAVSSLPPHVLQFIDRAFDKAISESLPEPVTGRPRKRQRIIEDAPGGFIVDDDEAVPAGGFIVDESEDTMAIDTGTATHIPLSLIPRALQLLDLPPHDQEVLDVFANAASGWEGQTDFNSDGSEERAVSRKDWRAVCAVLVPSMAEEDEYQNMDKNDDAQSEVSSLSPLSSDEYVEDDDASDEYNPLEEKPRGKQNKTKAHSRISKEELTSNESTLTARQKREALTTFALFFPDVRSNTDDDTMEEVLRGKVLTPQDISAAAASIKERISAEEVSCHLYQTLPNNLTTR